MTLLHAFLSSVSNTDVVFRLHSAAKNDPHVECTARQTVLTYSLTYI